LPWISIVFSHPVILSQDPNATSRPRSFNIPQKPN